MAAIVGVVMGALWGPLGCDNCWGVDVWEIEKGTFVVEDVRDEDQHGWLVGAEVEVTSRTVTISYDHHESSWETRYRVD
jgi:hypothetical protein